MRGLSELSDKTLLVIKAPPDTIMECDNDEEVSVLSLLQYSSLPLLPQSYKMHLLSHNGPVDVLVCPDTVEEGVVTTPKINTTHKEQLDVSLSSIATSAHDENISNGMDTFPDLLGLGGATPTHGKDQVDTFLPVVDMFEALSPPCNDEQFYPSLSPNEGILELFDLA